MPAMSQQVSLPPRYRVVRHIANGGMATVWAAEDSILERLVAVKVLAPGYAVDEAARRRFTREARAAARVSDHPNVVTIFDIGEHDGVAFIVMEHFPGGTIADRLRRGDEVPTPLALSWLREAASALDAAHAADIVHRDVKPGNLLLDENGRLAVGDFGIASIAGETAVTAAGQVLGTAAYLSPEQARGWAATPASDRYSLAVVAFELLCGRRPFDGDTPMAQARAHVEVDPPTPDGPSEAAAGVLTRGLSKDPAKRPPTATAFVEGLREALGPAAEPAADEPPTEVTRRIPVADAPRFARAAPVRAQTAAPPRRRDDEPPPAPVARRRPGRRALPLALLALLCLAAGAAAALISDSGNGGGDQAANTSGRTAAPSADKPAPKKKAKPKKKKATQTTAAAPAAAAPAATTPAPTTTQAAPPATDGRSAVSLNNQGYAMLPGNPQGAIPLLQRAVQGFRSNGLTGDVNYAYSLYNLGWALRLGGRPKEAIPSLEERLRISNYKRGVVQQELDRARRDAGGS